MENYFNYFTEIEEHFQQRRGSLLLLSTLDWSLIETWREAGVPLEAVLRGIDAAFDKYEARRQRGRARRVNGLAYCAQEVMQAAEQMLEAATGRARGAEQAGEAPGFEVERIVRHLESCAAMLGGAGLDGLVRQAASEASRRLRELALEIAGAMPKLEELERTLLVLEEKLFATLTATAPEEELVALREQAARELAPYRGKMQAVQVRQVEQQFLHKRLLENRKLPRLSLFYMGQS